MHPLRVAFPIVASRAWQGGFNYQLNLCRALAAHANSRVEPVAFFGEDVSTEDVARFVAEPGIEVICHAAFSHGGRTAKLLRALILGLDYEAEGAFNSARIDLVFESARFFGRRLRQPVIAWFPDFQHRRLPELFKKAAWLKREIGFRMQIRHGRAILVSSEDARNDCETYYPWSCSSVYVMHFPAVISESDLSSKPAEILQKYSLPERFIYLPNQFWLHKNHALVLEALGILQQRGVPMCVVTTGGTNDPRDPSLFSNIQKKIDELGLSRAFRVLGVVPRSHVVALLRICKAFLNPSRCEGWSSGVEEAKLFGVPMLLSDLAVHREQAGSSAQYFPIDDSIALADLLAVAIDGPLGENSPRQLLVDADERTRGYAKSFADIASQIFEKSRA